jgi:hypothetical protein
MKEQGTLPSFCPDWVFLGVARVQPDGNRHNSRCHSGCIWRSYSGRQSLHRQDSHERKQAASHRVRGAVGETFLLPGTYSVTAEKDGFRPVKEENIKLDVSQNRSVDFHLTIGMVTQEVQVSAAAAPIDVNTSAVGQVIDSN